MPKAYSRKHGPAHAHLILFFDHYYFPGTYSFVDFPCSCTPINMAGVGYGVTLMPRLSQHSSPRRPHKGKSLDLSSPNSLSKKKVPKRKTLSSRYSTVLPSKRRRIGLNTIKEPAVTLGESHKVSEACHVAVSPKACNASEVSSKEKNTRTSGTRGRPRKSKANTKAKARGASARVKASRSLKAELCPIAKHLDPEEISNEEDHPATGLFHLNATVDVGSLSDGNHTIPSLLENVNLKGGRRVLETTEAGALLLARKNDVNSLHVEPRQCTEKHASAVSRALGRKSRKRFSSLESPGYGLRASKDCHSNEISLLTLAGSRVQEFPIQEVTSLLKKNPSLLEGNFLRPRRKAKKKLKFEEHQLPPWDYVGKRVVVYWPHAKAWYAGKVIMYDDTTKKHKIKYDDSDEECISFRRHKVILEKSLSPIQLADVQNKGVFPSQRVQLPEEEAAAPKATLGDCVEDRNDVEDDVLLSAAAPGYQVRECSCETLCNGPGTPIGAVKGHDATANNIISVHKSSKILTSFATEDNTRKPLALNKGVGGGKEAFVYVRRTKNRRKADVLPTNTALDGRIYESNAVGTVETSRKRKSCQFFPQTAQTEFPDCNFYDDESSSSDAPPTLGNGSNPSERASRKRTKRSLKKLVNQDSIVVGTGVAQDPEPRLGQLRKQRARRTRRKPGRRPKLINTHFSARNRSLPTKGVNFLADDTEEVFEGSSSTLCLDAAMLCNLTRDGLLPESLSLFVKTIHLSLPALIPDLFTWQLFSVFTCMHFCEGGSFDEIFALNGTLQDWVGIFRILLSIIKAVPLSAYRNGRQWQRSILHELWNSMLQGEQAQIDTLASLTPEVETLVSERLLDATVHCRMTNREILNLFVCYFIKPYILATICEKGISIRVAVRKFLLVIKSKDRGTACLRRPVNRFLLQPSFGGADRVFSSYLMFFLKPADWFTEEGFFLRQMQEWIATATRAECTEIWNPIPAIKKFNNLVWEVTSVHVINREHAMDEFKHKTSKTVKLPGSKHDISLKCSRHANSWFDEEWSSSSGTHNGCCLNSALLYTACLQKRLNITVGKDLGSGEACCDPARSSLSLGKSSGTDGQVKRTKRAGLLLKDASEFKISAGLSGLATVHDHSAFSYCWKSAVNVPLKDVKVEPDINLSLRNSSITTECNSAGINEESSVEMYACQEPLTGVCLKSDMVGQTHAGFQVKPDEQQFSGKMDQDYYDNESAKNVKMVIKSRPRYRTERRPLLKKRPTYFCMADLVFLSNSNGCPERELGVTVKLLLNADSSFLIAVHVNGKSFEQKILEGGMLAKNPGELLWKSGNGWTLEFPDREQWELFRCMYNELCSQAMGAACAREIPIPGVKEVDAFFGASQSRSSLRPFFAIKAPGEEIETAFKTGRVLYDLDSEDEDWMAEINRVSRDFGSEIICEEALEQIIDRLEKEAYERRGQTVTVHDAMELCQGLAVADSVRAVHTYWSNKRLAKGKSLLRYFQPPLWEQYRDELQKWEFIMQQYSPDLQNTILDRYPRPIMSAFCLQSRSFDNLNDGKRLLRQRSQRKIRPTSHSSSEDSQRLPVYRYTDSTRCLTHDSKYAHSVNWLHQHVDYCQEDEGLPGSAKAARAKAVEARSVAEKRALKLHHRFLEFDLLLQRAWASLIEYTVSGNEASAQCGAFEERMARLLTRCSSLFNKGDEASDDEPPSRLGQVCRNVDVDFLEAFSKKCCLTEKVVLCKEQVKVGDGDFEEASPLLPIFVKGSSYAWNGSSLL